MAGKKGARVKWTEKELHKLGNNLIEHCQLEDVFHITDWTGKVQNKSQQWWYKLIKAYPMLVEYHERAKEILGNKIVSQAFKSGNTWAVKTFVPKYLSDVKKHLREELAEECRIKAEATRDAIAKDPDHPFWGMLDKYIEEGESEKTPKR